MYPSQTSLIPATVSLVRFFGEKGFSAFFQNYPYWYLGSTPFRYLIGPVVPILEIALKSLINVSLLSISIYLVIFFAVLGGIGWILLVRKFFVNLSFTYYLFLFIFYLFFPFKYLSGLAFSELSAFISLCLLPFILLTFGKKIWPAVISSALLFLINTNIITSLLVGAVSFALARSFKDGKIKQPEERIKRYLASIAIGLLISTLWYNLGFWFAILSNPGIGGHRE